MWQLLTKATLLKHKILLGLMYGCGLRCIEVRNIRLRDLDFDRKMLHIVQSKGKKDRYVPLSDHIIRGLQKYIGAERAKYVAGLRTAGIVDQGLFDALFAKP